MRFRFEALGKRRIRRFRQPQPTQEDWDQFNFDPHLDDGRE